MPLGDASPSSGWCYFFFPAFFAAFFFAAIRVLTSLLRQGFALLTQFISSSLPSSPPSSSLPFEFSPPFFNHQLPSKPFLQKGELRIFLTGELHDLLD